MGISIGTLSKVTEVNVETIRYYEREGLIPEPGRTVGGHRIYQPEDQRRLKFIKRSRQLGFSLLEVRELLVLVDGGYTCSEVKQLVEHHKADIVKKINDLRQLKNKLGQLTQGCTGLPDDQQCPIMDALLS